MVSIFARVGVNLSLAVAAWTCLAAPARADYEYWGSYETRIPLTDKAPLTKQPVQLRIFSDLRYGLRYPGLGWQFFRLGPLWSVTPWMFVGTHFTTIGVQTAPGVLNQEYRGEIEPNLFGRLGEFSWNDRNRLEYRWRSDDAHFRYRNQLRVAYAPPGAKWQPFVWEEVMVELNSQGFAQNRAEVGIARQLADYLRLDLGLMVRSRAAATGAWDHDLVLNSYLLFAPKLDPVFGSSGGE